MQTLNISIIGLHIGKLTVTVERILSTALLIDATCNATTLRAEGLTVCSPKYNGLAFGFSRKDLSEEKRSVVSNFRISEIEETVDLIFVTQNHLLAPLT